MGVDEGDYVRAMQRLLDHLQITTVSGDAFKQLQFSGAGHRTAKSDMREGLLRTSMVLDGVHFGGYFKDAVKSVGCY